MTHSPIKTADFIIIGAGIIGLSIARELKKRYSDCKIIILEKETQEGEHASGRNSGVLHAGFYYSKDSLKAKLTKQGNIALTKYCIEKNIPLNRCGKLVVARDEKDLVGLHELMQRGKTNDIVLQFISAQDAKEIEPRIKTFQHAIFSPTTSSVDPKIVLKHIREDAEREGISMHFNVRFLNQKNNKINTTQGEYESGFIVNSAGLYADQVARQFGFSKNYYILPFKGLYLYATQPTESFRTHIYPVPDLKNPFLGVHFTISYDGHVKIGPTAIPAFWREQYQGISKFNYKELFDIVYRELTLLIHAGFDFKRLALNEIKKYNRTILVNHAAELAHDVRRENYTRWGKPGIRAQLINIKTRQLEMDFILEGDDRSYHILNAVSPAFTCSMPFANYVVDQIQKKIK